MPQAAAEPEPQPEPVDDVCPTCTALLAVGDPRVEQSVGFRPLLRLKGPVLTEADREHIWLHAQRREPVVMARGSSFPHPGDGEGWADDVAAACGDKVLTFQVFDAAPGTPEAQRRPQSAPVSMCFATVLGGRNTRSLGGSKLCLKCSDLSPTSAELADKQTANKQTANKQTIQQTAIAELMESAVGSLAAILPGADYLLVRLPLPRGDIRESEVCSRGNRRFIAMCGCCVHPSATLTEGRTSYGLRRRYCPGAATTA